eukprot:m.430758 g.430758  ORF g.430758 m.430758 type:complete len:69 (+) comp17209_c0_seq1:1222-1428(+)
MLWSHAVVSDFNERLALDSDVTFRFAGPRAVSFTLAAKRSEQSVSPRQSVRGDTLTIIKHFESFPSAS